MEQQYKGYFVTIACKEGVPMPIADLIYKVLEPKCLEIDYVMEEHKSGLPHMHIMLFLNRARRKSDFKVTVQTIVYKYISKPLVSKGINVLLVDNMDSFEEYIQKTGRMLQIQFKEMRKYVFDNFGKAKDIIAANKKFKETCIKYSYDNYDTWKKEFEKLNEIADMWRRYVHLIKLNYGKTPSSQWKLEMMFECHLTNMGLMDEKSESVPSKYLKYNKDKKIKVLNSDTE